MVILRCAIAALFAQTIALGVDCNENGWDDAEEMAITPGLDCNGNGVLDECDLGLPWPNLEHVDAVQLGVPRAFLASGDVDGDGEVDILAISSSNAGSSALLLADGTEWREAPTPAIAGTSRSVALVDIDGDNKLDAVVGDDEATVFIWINETTSPGRIQWRDPVRVEVGAGVRGIVVGDIGGNGTLEVVALLRGSRVAVVGWSNETGTPRAEFFDVDKTARQIAAGDFDGDGDADLVIAALNLDEPAPLEVIYFDGEVRVRRFVPLDSPMVADIRAADFDDDGRDEIIVSHNLNHVGALQIFSSTRTRTWGEYDASSLTTLAAQTRPWDVNGDGSLDLVTHDGSSVALHLGFSNRLVGTGSKRTTALGVRDLAVFEQDAQVLVLVSTIEEDAHLYRVVTEVQPDCNDNGIHDRCESTSDCNSNRIPDECELASRGLEVDCDENGILDACERDRDCNFNGTPDVCDLQNGAADLNDNAILDSCEIAQGAPDCNRNGVLDSIETASGARADCDDNGVLDECQITLNPELDCDANGTLDSCEANGNCDAHNLRSRCWEAEQLSFSLPVTTLLPGRSRSSPGLAVVDSTPGRVSLVRAMDDRLLLLKQIRRRFEVTSTVRLQGPSRRFTSAELFGGKPSVVVRTDDAVEIFHVEDGELRERQSISIGTPPGLPLFGDFDGDGDLDIAAPSFRSILADNVTLLLSDGVGTLERGASYVVGHVTGRGTAVDVTGDGRDELVLPAQDKLVFLSFAGDGHLERQWSTPLAGVRHVKTADLDGNGTPDVVGTDAEGLFLLENASSDSPTRRSLSPEAYHADGFADINDDGRLDVISTTNNRVTVLVQTSPMEFSAEPLVRTQPWIWATPVDLNGDRTLDLIAMEQNGNVATIIQSPNDGFAQSVWSREGHIEFARVLEEGDQTHLLTASINAVTSTTRVTKHMGDRSGRADRKTSTEVRGVVQSLTTGDWNSDGYVDVALLTTLWRSTDTVHLLLGGEHLLRASSITVPSNRQLLAGDANGDGHLDLLAVASAHTQNGAAVDFYAGDSTGRLSAPTSSGSSPPGSVRKVAAGDFDGDGDLDVVREIVSGRRTLHLLTGDGHGAFSQAAEHPLIALWAWTVDSSRPVARLWLATESTEGHGLDVLCGRWTESGLNVAAHARDVGYASIGVGIALGDFDGDEILDVGLAAGSFHALLSKSPALKTLDGVSIGNRNLLLSDMNDDGLCDLVLYDANELSVALTRWDRPARGIPPGTEGRCRSSFRRGDVNDDESLNVADVTAIARHLFGGSAVPCVKSADVNDSGTVNVTDMIALLRFLFAGGAPPMPPAASCGVDPTEDALSCDESGCL